MIKIKEFTELTEKDKASIRELIDDCIRYEQLELAVPDLNEEDGTAYLYYQSSKNPKHPANCVADVAFSAAVRPDDGGDPFIKGKDGFIGKRFEALQLQ